MLVMCTHLARSVALRTCSGNTLAQPEVPDKHAFATSGAARGYVGMRGAGHTRPDDHLKRFRTCPGFPVLKALVFPGPFTPLLPPGTDTFPSLPSWASTGWGVY